MDKDFCPFIWHSGVTNFLKKRPQDINEFRIKVRANSTIKPLDLRAVTLHYEGYVQTAISFTPSLSTHTHDLGTFRSKTNVTIKMYP